MLASYKELSFLTSRFTNLLQGSYTSGTKQSINEPAEQPIGILPDFFDL